jgi:hypothetical protein
VPANRAIVSNTNALRQAAAAFAILLLTAIVGHSKRSPALLLAALGLVIIAAGIVPVHNMLWMGPHLLNARYLYLAAAGFVLVATGLCFGFRAELANRHTALIANLVPALIWLLSFSALAVANREQWLSNASISGGIARDLQALDGSGEIERIEFVGFPSFWMGSYIFHLSLLPEVALNHPYPVDVHDTLISATPPGPVSASSGMVARYRFLGGERLWLRESPRLSQRLAEP